jgi:hypothetical protein
MLLSACIEPARSADVPPEVAQQLSARASANAAAKQLGSLPAALASSTRSALYEPDAGMLATGDAFFGEPDRQVREALAKRPIVSIQKGRGGRSLGFKITLEGGQRGYFKGEQTFSAANWFGEVAAYHLDRMLGLGRVPAVVSRVIPWNTLEDAARDDYRRHEIIYRDGQVRGAFVAWVDEALKPLEQEQGWERWVRVRYWPTTAVSPFQRPAVWAKELVQAQAMGNAFRSKEERLRRRNAHPEPDRPDRPAELSDLIVFDYLCRNLDRWGGNNANVLVRGPGGPLIFLDNAAGFEPGPASPSLMESRLKVLQRFRRRTIQAVRAFDVKKFEARLASEPLAPVLNKNQLSGLIERRESLLSYVSELEEQLGEAIWAWE